MARRSPKSAAARHHAEWLSLVETSGPFLSLPVLLRAFPQGLDAEDPDHQRELRLAIDEWEEAQEGEPDRAIHTAWIRFVLTRTLELPAEVLAEGAAVPAALRVAIPEQGETLAPDIVVVNPSGTPAAGRARLLIQTYPSDQALGRAVAGRRWKASPETRLLELLRGTGARIGLATNGEHWLLANATPRGSPGTASWYTSLWTDEPVTLRAFRSLLGTRRFFSAAETDTLEALLDESAANQQEVTDQLGLQVRHAVEVLVRSVDRANRDQSGSLLRGVSEEQLYQAAVTVMMRLVFLFAAEERGLLLLGDPLFDQHYAVSTLRAQLREAADQHGEDVLERRYDAWARLLATFRAVHGGIAHDRLRLPAYGGTLFDPDRFPFLEGRLDATTWRTTAASPLPIHNRTVLHLLEALQLLAVQVPGGGAEARKLSFKALDIEQIGHVYEGLLDHTARRARTPVLGLEGTQKKEPEVPLDQLEALRLKGEDELVSFLKEETGRSVPALRKKLAYDPDSDDEQRFVVSCDNDEGLYGRVRPFIGLVREDTFHEPVVIPTGSVYVTAGTDRRETGTHYTQRSLTEPIVQHALEPLLYVGPAEGKPREEWVLRPAAEVLALRVCDPTMGSGAFLVQACRFLSERLVEAWEAAERDNPSGPGITPTGAPSSGDPGELLIPHDTEERLALARRLVTDRCLYGVDINPMAVEMAKLSLWLVTLQKDRPFTFLDHALRPGDSLLGITLPDQIEWMHIEPKAGTHQGRDLPIWGLVGRPALAAAVTKRRELEGFPVVDIADAERKARLLAEAQYALEGVHILADLVVGAALAAARHEIGSIDDALVAKQSSLERAFDPALADEVRAALLRELAGAARSLLGHGPDRAPRRPFHWLVEFPEVFASGVATRLGFDCIVGNPPFRGGKLISGDLGTGYRELLVDRIANGARGNADLSAYFVLRASQLVVPNGMLGLVATNTIAQGDTRAVGLDQLVARGFSIPRAVASRKWPGDASLEVAYLWLRRGLWTDVAILDDLPVSGITAALAAGSASNGSAHRLAANSGKSFQGSIVLGMGFLLSADRALELFVRNQRNRDVVFPYLNGEDLNSRPDQSASRWVINFFDWPLDRCADGTWRTAPATQRKEWRRSGHVPSDYPDHVAADYPDALQIVESQVKPERQRRNADGTFALRRPLPERWWQYADKRPALYAAIGEMTRVFITTRVSAYHFVGISQVGPVFSDRLVVFSLDSWAQFAVLSSSIHDEWAHRPGSTTHETRRTYFHEEAFWTFPFPHGLDGLDEPGRQYHQVREDSARLREEGLRDIYRRFHDKSNRDHDIVDLRGRHMDIDARVVRAYGWTNLDLAHGFHETKQGTRFTISDTARHEVLDRLLRLNHERHAEEVAATNTSAAEGRPARKGRGRSAAPGTGDLFD